MSGVCPVRVFMWIGSCHCEPVIIQRSNLFLSLRLPRRPPIRRTPCLPAGRLAMTNNNMINLKPVHIREEIIKATRAFFYERKFHEVIVPVLNDVVPLESHLFPFQTSWNTVHGEKNVIFLYPLNEV